MPEAIHVRNLRKSYPRPLRFRDVPRFWRERPRTSALRGIDLSVHPGRVFGLLGPNGAGKTSLMKILSGILLPDAGEVRVSDVDVLRRPLEARRSLGFVPSDERSFYWRLTGRQNLQFFGRLQGLRGADLRSRVDRVLEEVEMADRADERFDGWSTGLKQRLALARGLLHDPPVLLLDEPTRSLDPSAAHRLRQMLRELVGDRADSRMARTVVLATHDLPEALDLCDEVALLSKGRILRQGSPQSVFSGEEATGFRLEFTGVEPGSLDLDLAQDGLEHQTIDGGLHRIEGPGDPSRATPLLRAILEAGGRVRRLEPLRPGLDEVFSRLVEESEAGATGTSGATGKESPNP